MTDTKHPSDLSGLIERLKPSALVDSAVDNAIRALRTVRLAMTASALNNWLVKNNALKTEAADALSASIDLEGGVRVKPLESILLSKDPLNDFDRSRLVDWLRALKDDCKMFGASAEDTARMNAIKRRLAQKTESNH